MKQNEAYNQIRIKIFNQIYSAIWPLRKKKLIYKISYQIFSQIQEERYKDKSIEYLSSLFNQILNEIHEQLKNI